MNHLQISDLLFSANSTIELFLPLRFLEENTCFESFSILADQGLAIQCYIAEEEVEALTNNAFLHAKIHLLSTQGVGLFSIKPDQLQRFYLIKDGSTYFEYDPKSQGLHQKLYDEKLSLLKNDALYEVKKELIPTKWPDIELSVDKSLIKVGDKVVLYWNAPEYDGIKCADLSETSSVGQVLLEPLQTTVLIIDFIFGKRIKRKVVRIEVIQELAIQVSVSVKNVLTNTFELLQPLDLEKPIYSIKKSTPVEIRWSVDYADEVHFSPFGKVEKEGVKRFVIETALALKLSAKLGNSIKEMQLQIESFPTALNTELLHDVQDPGTFNTNYTRMAWSDALDQKKIMFARQSSQLEQKISQMYQELIINKEALRERLNSMNNRFQKNAKFLSSSNSNLGDSKKYDYSTILHRFSKNKG